MKLSEFLLTLDNIHPLWINSGDDCDYYENKNQAIRELFFQGFSFNESIEYITLDGDGIITIEI